MKSFRSLGIFVLALLWCSGIALTQDSFTAGTWTPLAHTPPAGIGHMVLLTDGSVLGIDSACNTTGIWYRLVPDSTGSYLNGTWVATGSLPTGYNPLYFASQVLPSGQVVVIGGEYLACVGKETTKGAVYNPATNKWQTLAAPTGWTTVGDADSVLLPTGHMMLANCCNSDEAILTIASGKATWAATGTGKADSNSEEGWNLLPDGNVLTVDAYVGSYNATGTNSEIYNTSAGTWSSAGSTVAQLWDSAAACISKTKQPSYEVGPAVLRPDGTIFATGANTCGAGNTAIYNTATGTWAAGPAFPGTLDIADGPAALLPDGNVLVDASPGVYKNGTQFFEWDGSVLNPTSNVTNAAVDPSYVGSMVILPTGQVLWSDNSSTLEIYTSAGSPCSGCAPTISSVPSTLTHGKTNNRITGTQFNGLSQGAAYGDDAQSATNYPIVRITDASGAVVYCKTHGWTVGVATGSKSVATMFDIPSTIALGPATIEVVANGIASAPKSVTIN